MIEVEQISKTFRLSKQQRNELNTKTSEIKAVNNVSFQCQPGRIFTLLGPNGAGKTTILRMIATILKPAEGSIRVNGFDTVADDGKVRQQIGFLTGTTGLYKRLTPDELVSYFAKLHGIAPAIFKKRKEELFTLLGMHDFVKKRIGQLSTGMKQKVSIARTIIHDPSVVIFDEPTTGLDVITAANIIQLIRQCKQDGKTVIFSSHTMSEVDLLCDDLAIIHKGRLCYASTMEQFRQQMQTESITEEFIRIVNREDGVIRI